ncbi:MAG: 50S ribosomal protein L25/general stress protein Ctc [Thermonemataceae bacterium]
MRTVEIIGYKRANLGKSESKRLRREGHVPGVLYGGKEQVAFYTPMILFRNLIYTPEPAFVKLNIEGDEYDCILQDFQEHPVSETLLHVDFLLLRDDRKITMDIPVKTEGKALGSQKGGKVIMRLRKLKIKSLPKHMPEAITVNVEPLDLGKSIKVKEVEPDNYEILNALGNPIVTVEVPRALRGKGEEEEGEEATEEVAAE